MPIATGVPMSSPSANNSAPGSRERDAPSSLLDLLRRSALEQPLRRAFTYLHEGETEAAHLTAGELDQQARAIGGLLQSLKAKGERALLVYPAGLEFIAAFFGCIYGGVIAVPMAPPNPARLGRTLPKFQAVAKDAQPSVVLTVRSILDKFEPILAMATDLKALRWLATDDISPDLSAEWQEFSPATSSLAYLQYTSGSTSLPKGVMVSHENVFYDAACLEADWAHNEDSVIVNWLPHFHDFGLLYGKVQPIYSSVPCILMSPIAFLQKPSRWLQALSYYKGTHCAAPNFAYDLCVRKTPPAQRAALDLSNWRVAGNGGEPVRKDTLERFSEAFGPAGFRMNAFCPGWGLAEGTLRVTGTRYADRPVYKTVLAAELKHRRVVETDEQQEGGQTFVGSGSPAPSTEVAIVNPETLTRCAPDEVGEIWVSGPCVTQGYWNRPEETERTFQAHLAEMKEGPFLRTGDLGFFKDNVIFIAGRCKDMIIIRGTNYY